MGVSIQQWRSAIGCFSSKSSFKTVTNTDQSSSASNLPRPNLCTLVILTILTVSLYSYCILDQYNSTVLDCSQFFPSEFLPLQSIVIVNFLPPWPPDSCVKGYQSLNNPTCSLLASPVSLSTASLLPWLAPAWQASASSSPWSTCTSSVWLGTWSPSPPPVWTSPSQSLCRAALGYQPLSSPSCSTIWSPATSQSLLTHLLSNKKRNKLVKARNGNRQNRIEWMNSPPSGWR